MLIVDDTIGNFANIDLLQSNIAGMYLTFIYQIHANFFCSYNLLQIIMHFSCVHEDAVCTSLTKLFNGRGDAMAGSVILSERYVKENGGILEQKLCGEEELFCSDASALFANSEVRYFVSC